MPREEPPHPRKGMRRHERRARPPEGHGHTMWRTRLLLHAETKFAAHDTSIHRVIANAGKVILGKERQIRLAVACLLARGHLLIEDLPGVGKTTLAHVLAKVLGLQFQRIQFTADLLPADILGVAVYERAA